MVVVLGMGMSPVFAELLRVIETYTTPAVYDTMTHSYLVPALVDIAVWGTDDMLLKYDIVELLTAYGIPTDVARTAYHNQIAQLRDAITLITETYAHLDITHAKINGRYVITITMEDV